MQSNRIMRLDEVTQGKIAAGEVVEKPAMVVKELVENSVDAGATEIIIDIKKGGKKLIRVVDNGSGIHRDDVDLIFERHATSKIRKIDDLYKTLTLGFRGEALASICAVSRIELITMREDDEYAIKLDVSGGNILERNEIGSRRGTSIAVRDLYFNTPARLKFLKSDVAEQKAITEILGNLALSHPEIAFKYTSDDQLVFKTPGDNKVENAIFSVYDRVMIKNLYEIKHEDEALSLRGYISKFEYTKGTRQQQLIFVNGRYIKSDIIRDAIQLAYKPYLMQNRFPVCFLFLSIDPDKIDVNIHPAKTEIKFHDDGIVKQFIYTALRKAFNLQNQVPEIVLSKDSKLAINYEQSTVREDEKNTVIADKQNAVRNEDQSTARNEDQITTKEDKATATATEENTNIMLDSNVESQYNLESQISFDKTKESRVKGFSQNQHEFKQTAVDFSKVNLEPLHSYAENLEFFNSPLEEESIYDRLEYIGSFLNSYLIYQKDEKLFLIDQHAAHEKVLYEKYVELYNKNEILSQVLLVPEIIEMDSISFQNFKEYGEYFNRLGYLAEEFGDRSIIIREIPSILDFSTSKAVFLAALEGLETEMDDILLSRLMTKACKAAIKAADKLSEVETKALLDQLKSLNEPYTCPHGRPIVISFSKYEIEKKFKRII